nr:lysoplasmalogenase [Aquimarina spongiae]
MYVIIALCDLVLEYLFSNPEVRYITKPAIVCSLLIFLILRKTTIPLFRFNYLLMGLILSLAGDIFLLFQGQLFFILGLVMFLFAHIFYILLFVKDIAFGQKSKLFLVLTTVYGFGLFFLLYSNLKAMLIPVIVYMIVILGMANTSYFRSQEVGKKSYLFVLMGALVFMLSDSLLAVNMFYTSLPYSHIWIMSTYALAQLLIVYGIIYQNPPLYSEKNKG